MDIIVNKEIYQETLKYYPNFKYEKNDLLFFFTLIYNQNNIKNPLTEEYDFLLNSRFYKKLFNDKFLNLSKYISEFESKYNVEIRYSPYSITNKLTRELISFKYNDELNKFISTFRINNKDKYILVNNQRQVTTNKKIMKHQVPAKLNTDQQLICEKLNNYKVSQLLQNKFRKNKDELISQILLKYPCQCGKVNKDKEGSYCSICKKGRREISVLNNCENIKSEYFLTKSEIRCFAKKHNPVHFKKEFRKIAMKGCYDLDLKSSQLSIFAKLTNSKILLDKLKTKNFSIWKYFSNVVNENDQYTDDQKKDWKIFLYSIIFGASKTKLKSIKSCSKLMNCELVIEILDQRDKLMNRVKNDGFIMDVYNTKHMYSYDNETKTSNLRSIISYVIQSYELKLISECFRLSSYANKYKIICMQHDGITVAILDNDKKDKVLNAMISIVDKKAKKLDILTTLEVEKL